MAVHIDPEGHEIAAVSELLPRRAGLRVLEIGCGDGRLTCRYAHMADRVLAVDSSAEAIEEFRASMPAGLGARVEVRVSTIEALTIPDDTFDVVLMSRSL